MSDARSRRPQRQVRGVEDVDGARPECAKRLADARREGPPVGDRSGRHAPAPDLHEGKGARRVGEVDVGDAAQAADAKHSPLVLGGGQGEHMHDPGDPLCPSLVANDVHAGPDRLPQIGLQLLAAPVPQHRMRLRHRIAEELALEAGRIGLWSVHAACPSLSAAAKSRDGGIDGTAWRTDERHRAFAFASTRSSTSVSGRSQPGQLVRELQAEPSGLLGHS